MKYDLNGKSKKEVSEIAKHLPDDADIEDLIQMSDALGNLESNTDKKDIYQRLSTALKKLSNISDIYARPEDMLRNVKSELRNISEQRGGTSFGRTNAVQELIYKAKPTIQEKSKIKGRKGGFNPDAAGIPGSGHHWGPGGGRGPGR